MQYKTKALSYIAVFCFHVYMSIFSFIERKSTRFFRALSRGGNFNTHIIITLKEENIRDFVDLP